MTTSLSSMNKHSENKYILSLEINVTNVNVEVIFEGTRMEVEVNSYGPPFDLRYCLKDIFTSLVGSR